MCQAGLQKSKFDATAFQVHACKLFNQEGSKIVLSVLRSFLST